MHITTPASKSVCREYTSLWRTALRKTIRPQVVHGLTNAEIAFDTGTITPLMQNQLIAIRELYSCENAWPTPHSHDATY